MTNIVLIAHGNLASEMKKSAEMIFGALPHMSTIAFCEEEGFDSITQKVLGALQDSKEETLIFADLFGGTPYNASCKVALLLKEKQTIEVLSGMSLPLVLEMAMTDKNMSARLLANQVKEMSQHIVQVFEKQIEEETEDF